MRRNDVAVRVALIYLVAGAAWIALSDEVLLALFPDHLRAGQAAKGIVFVILSATLIYFVVRRELGRRRAVEAEREELRTRLAGSQRLEALGRLTGGIAHDFNNLLTAISGNLESYLVRVAPDDGSEADVVELSEAAAAARRAEELTRQLLAFGRQQALRPHPLDLGDVIREMVQILHRLIGDRIDVETHVPRDLWVITMDRGPLQQVVMNLALNSRDAMPDGGRLRLATDNVRISADQAEEDFEFPFEPGDYVRLRVEDTGTGMDEETRARIYEPFFTTKEKHLGTGLGMSTVYGVVKQSGGYIDLDTAPGEGTRFDLYFPRGKGSPRPAPDRAAAAPAELRGTETILVVEDEDAVRSVITRTLERQGFTPLACSAGPEALAILKSDVGSSVDLLVTDAIMPGMNGTELIGHARRIHPHLPALLISGYSEEELDSRQPYLAKPFTTGQLITRIRQTLASPEHGSRTRDATRSP